MLLALTGALSLVHRDVAAAAAALIRHMHLNPASGYPHMVLDAASRLHDGSLVAVALGACAYALLRLVEAYGLFRERAWAEVLAAGSAAIYVPFELVELVRSPAWPVTAILLVNVAVVVVMLRALFGNSRTRVR